MIQLTEFTAKQRPHQASKGILCLLLAGSLAFSPLASAEFGANAVDKIIALKAFPEADVDTEKQGDPQAVLHSNLVKSALLNDAFGKRCRGRSVAKYFNKVNRLYITKYSVSANNYIESYIAPDFRDYKEDFEHLFSRSLAQKGGCGKAKDNDWDKQMLAEFKALFREVESSNWYPIIKRF